MAFDGNPRGVSHVGHPLGRIEIRDMMRSVARRVQHAKFTRSQSQRLAALQNAQIVLRHGQEIPK